MGGEHLLKLTQSSIRSDYGRHFVDGSERREIWAELTALKMQLVEGFDAKKLKAAKSSPTLFAPKGLELRNRPSVIHRAQLRAERRTKSKMMGPRDVGKSSYKGTKLEDDGGADGDDKGYQFRSDGFLSERV